MTDSTPHDHFTECVEALWLAALDIADLTVQEQYVVNVVGRLIPPARMAGLVGFITDPPPTLFEAQ